MRLIGSEHLLERTSGKGRAIFENYDGGSRNSESMYFRKRALRPQLPKDAKSFAMNNFFTRNILYQAQMKYQFRRV